jgi:hypothetical protein
MKDSRFDYRVRLVLHDGSQTILRDEFEGPDLPTLIDWFREWTLADARILARAHGLNDVLIDSFELLEVSKRHWLAS